MAQIDTYIKFDGVDGESQHKAHKGEVEVFSWAWNASNVNTASFSGGGSGQGKAVPGDLTFMHKYDKASPVLAKKLVDGKHFDKVVLSCLKSGEGQKDFLVVTMKEVFITSIQPQGGGGGDLNESVAMSYKDIEFSYKPQDAKGGLGGEVKFGWNTETTETR